MTVRDMVYDMQSGVKYAVEIEYYETISDDGETLVTNWDTKHYVIGEATHNPYLSEYVRNIRVVADEIYIRICLERSTK